MQRRIPTRQARKPTSGRALETAIQGVHAQFKATRSATRLSYRQRLGTAYVAVGGLKRQVPLQRALAEKVPFIPLNALRILKKSNLNPEDALSEPLKRVVKIGELRTSRGAHLNVPELVETYSKDPKGLTGGGRSERIYFPKSSVKSVLTPSMLRTFRARGVPPETLYEWSKSPKYIDRVLARKTGGEGHA